MDHYHYHMRYNHSALDKLKIATGNFCARQRYFAGQLAILFYSCDIMRYAIVHDSDPGHTLLNIW